MKLSFGSPPPGFWAGASGLRAPGGVVVSLAPGGNGVRQKITGAGWRCND